MFFFYIRVSNYAVSEITLRMTFQLRKVNAVWRSHGGVLRKRRIQRGH